MADPLEFAEAVNEALGRDIEKTVRKTVVRVVDERHFVNSGGTNADKFNI